MHNSCHIGMKLPFYLTDLQKKTYNIKFHEYLTSGSSAVPHKTGMTKVTATFCNFCEHTSKVNAAGTSTIYEMVHKYQPLNTNIINLYEPCLLGCNAL
jgi:hypothetical protein